MEPDEDLKMYRVNSVYTSDGPVSLLELPDADLQSLGTNVFHTVSRLKANAPGEHMLSKPVEFIRPTLSPGPRRSPAFPHPRGQDSADDETVPDGTWAGIGMISDSGPFKSVSGMITMPSVGQAPGDLIDDLVCWVGIDGATADPGASRDVVQAGIGYSVEFGLTISSYWYEWFPAGPVVISGLPSITTGATLWISIELANSTEASLMMVSQGKGIGLSFSAPAGTQALGDIVEWVAERPSGGPLGNFRLPMFSDIYFSEMGAFTTEDAFPTDDNTLDFTMQQDNQTVANVTRNGSSAVVTRVKPEKGKDKEKEHEKPDAEKIHKDKEVESTQLPPGPNLPATGSSMAEPGGTGHVFIRPEERPGLWGPTEDRFGR